MRGQRPNIINKNNIMKKIILTLALVSVFALTGVASAASLYFSPGVYSSTATTTPTFIGAGLGTSTLVYDTYNQGNNYATDKATLLMQLAASSTATVLNINLEYSQDGIDWYKDNINYGATTTASVSLNTTANYSWTFASSTVGGIAVTAANGATSTKALIIPTPLRFVRTVFTMTGSAGALWSSIIPIKQKP